jgi:hypothetical protein
VFKLLNLDLFLLQILPGLLYIAASIYAPMFLPDKYSYFQRSIGLLPHILQRHW